MNCLNPNIKVFNFKKNNIEIPYFGTMKHFKKEYNIKNSKIIKFNNKKWILLPCNYCINCFINKKYEYKKRANNEYKKWKYCYFITLTYNQKNNSKVLIKKEIQNFLKYLKKFMKYSYLAVGEYGDVTNRPHYHLLIYTNKILKENLKLANGYFSNNLINKCWLNRGFNSIKLADDQAINYLTNYTQKSDIKRQNYLIKKTIKYKINEIKTNNKLNNLQKYIAIDQTIEQLSQCLNNWPTFTITSKSFGFTDHKNYKNMCKYQLKKEHIKNYLEDWYKKSEMFNYVEIVRPEELRIKYINNKILFNETTKIKKLAFI